MAGEQPKDETPAAPMDRPTIDEHGTPLARGSGRLAWLPIPFLLGAIVALRAMDLPGYYDSVTLVVALNFIFSTLASFFIAYLVARSFLVRGTPGLLLLGCGVVLWGPAAVLGTVVGSGDANVAVAIHNSCVWLSAFCHMAGVFLSLRPSRTLFPVSLWLLGGYMAAAGAVALVAWAVVAGWMPPFFIQGRGGTLLRQVVLGSAVGMFSLTALMLGTTGLKPLSRFAYWYALALALIAAGLLGVMLQSSRGSILGWVGRSAQFLGGLYMLIAAVASVRESHAWEISLATALSQSEDRYRTLVETAPDAILVHRDGRILYANDMAVRLSGAGTFGQLAQHSVLDFFRPGEREQAVERLLAAMAGNRLATREAVLRRLDGREILVEFHTAPVDFQGARAIQTIVRDITERKRAEEELRELNATLEVRVARRTAELEQRTRQLKKLALELSQAEDRERKRIAEILHEDLQQQIAGAKFHLSLLADRDSRSSQQQAAVAKVDEMLRDAIEKSRCLSHELNPAVLYQNDLAEALRWLAGQMKSKHHLAVHVDACDEVSLQSDALTIFLFRAAQEMLFNVVRHAKVKEAVVRVGRHGRYVRLSVSDQGRGFDPKKLTESTGFGLLSIRERSELLGGRMRIRSGEGKGSACTIVIPDDRPSEADGRNA
ncbi:MAG: PAS domain S-box protein [Phycisphaerales bacterium]